MPVNHYYVRATNGTDAPGGGGSHATAYQTVQYALDDIAVTHGKGAQGDQVNISDEAVHTLGASLSLATYGAPASGAPLILRGYTATANDGGGRPGPVGGRSPGRQHEDARAPGDLDLTGGVYTTPLVRLGNYCMMHGLKLTSRPSMRTTPVPWDHCRITGSHFRYVAGSATFIYAFFGATTLLAWGNYLDGCIASGNDDTLFVGNVCLYEELATTV
jgi:hypothetical protein